MKIMEIFRDKKKKVYIYIILLLGVLFLFIGSMEKEEKAQPEATERVSVPDTEERLEEILEQIEGVGETDVLIVYRDSGKKICATDVRLGEGSRETQTVMQSESGASAPFIVQEKEPTVKGVIIVADGGKEKSVEIKLKEAAAAVLEVYPHNIAVYGREKSEE